MLVFISDLHFEDATTGRNNVSSRAFEVFTDDLEKFCCDAEEIQLVLLGDTFDLNRSTAWLEPGAVRPWDMDEGDLDKVEALAHQILDKIITINQASLAIMTSWVKRGINGRAVKFVFIPGNHERLCNIYPSLRAKIRRTLLIPGGDEPFQHVYMNQEYRVFAFHGHEYEPNNFGGIFGKNMDFFDSVAYSKLTLGDIISTEFNAQIIYQAQAMKENIARHTTPEELQHFMQQISAIDYVRPASAVFKWLYGCVGEDVHLARYYKKVMGRVVDNVLKLDYVRHWLKERWYMRLLLGMVMGLGNFYNAVTGQSVHPAVRIMEFYLKRPYGKHHKRERENDILRDMIARELIPQFPDYDYFITGHTHYPKLSAISVLPDGREKVYFNTGTWRKVVLHCSQGGFQVVHQLASVCFYSKKENVFTHSKQVYEFWSGTLKEEAIRD